METKYFAAFDDFFKGFIQPFLKVQAPFAHLYVGLKNYNPSKPAKYGLLFWRFCNSTAQFTDLTPPYAGKPQGKLNQYYAFGMEKYIEYHVDNAIATDGKNSVKRKIFL